ncbi:hypothetical protein CERSUDRAFT_110653 [Gelatoporia subvermispora B]|uniref:T6SS Phospholipase effector Tle1-like catalytic domain-containing protein n=1 Tax=Ceriporiopsis subvermispora (strain B) TaxID=914234 RepID=M2RCD0_CERS8|nr:hypothetical protein CERSUDRAFT_110653 [Gelatoporia subvermispora B]
MASSIAQKQTPTFTANTSTPWAPAPAERSRSDPESSLVAEPRARIKKRIVVCCDGTWQDGIIVEDRWKYTNVMRLARAVNHTDDRFEIPIPQVVFYQSGIGSAPNIYDQIVNGVTGASLGDKVEEAYAFIAHNFQPGDEIFLFGFSRGAYTARMIGSLIGAIGVLDRMDMDHFAEIFIAYQKRGKATDQDEIIALDKQLAPWNQHSSPGKIRADSSPTTFSVKCVGVFDTVGSTGLPEEITMNHPKVQAIYGFNDLYLGEHIQRAYQALALNEMREDFNCAKFEQTEGGRNKGQVLKQCWFAGCHSDIGGGYKEHDLSDLTLTWMAANIGDILSLDMRYIASLPEPVAPWGEQSPHDSRTGIFTLSDSIQRKYPTSTDQITHEQIHPSVLKQHNLLPALRNTVDKNPSLIGTLLPLEEELQKNWPYKPKPAVQLTQRAPAAPAQVGAEAEIAQVVTGVFSRVTQLNGVVDHTTTAQPATAASKEWSMGALFREIVS